MIAKYTISYLKFNNYNYKIGVSLNKTLETLTIYPRLFRIEKFLFLNFGYDLY